MKINIFLDDYRQPQDAYKYTRNEIYLTEKWEVVKNYNQFVKKILLLTSQGCELGIISFDHDLADAYYQYQESIDYNELGEKTGYHCAKYLVQYCFENELKIPEYLCHSMNPVGKENILRLLNFESGNI